MLQLRTEADFTHNTVVEPESRSDESITVRSRATPAFGGRDDLATVYRAAKELFFARKLWLLKEFEEVDDVKRLTICNLWRIERHADGQVTLQEFCLRAGEWQRAGNLAAWPQIPIWPFYKARDPTYWRQVVTLAIWKALRASGYDALQDLTMPYPPKTWARHVAKHKKKGYVFDAESKTWEYAPRGAGYPRYMDWKTVRRLGLDVPQGCKREMRKRTMALSLISTLIRGTPTQGAEKGARALRAVIWDHVIDRQVLSAMLAIDRNCLPFWKYLDWASTRREELLRVASESRNLLPVLARIESQHWGRTDLFSRALWVKGSRRSTAVDRRGFADSSGQWQRACRFRSFDSNAGWKWLMHAPFRVVESWCRAGADPRTALNLAIASSGIKERIPVIAFQRLINVFGGAVRRRDLGVSPAMQRTYRLFLTDAAEVWRREGHKAVLLRTGNHAFGDVLDYLYAEGFAEGQPDKNATWNSILRRSADWHRRIAITQLESHETNLEWGSVLPALIVDQVTFTPVTSSRALAEEGYELSHCVGQYADWCQAGHYRVFAVSEPDGTRSTLGLVLKGKRAKVTIEQHRGKYNAEVSAAAKAAGVVVAKRYETALKATSRR